MKVGLDNDNGWRAKAFGHLCHRRGDAVFGAHVGGHADGFAGAVGDRCDGAVDSEPAAAPLISAMSLDGRSAMSPQAYVVIGAALLLGGVALPLMTGVPIFVGLIAAGIGLVIAVRAVID